MANEQKFVTPIVLAKLSADPSSPTNGLMYYNTTDNSVRKYENGAWRDTGLTGQALASGYVIIGNGSGVSAAVDSSSVGDISASSTNGLQVKAGAISNSHVNASASIALSKLAATTASKALVSDASGFVSASAVTSTELGYVAGVTSAIQTQLDAKVDESREGQANGIATLDAGGKIPTSQLPNSVMEFQGAWNANTNSPSLADGTGNAGDVYRVSVAGTQDLGSGSQTFGVGDWIMYNGSIWQHSPATDAVTSVNTFTGAVVLDTDDISEGTTNKYFSNELAQDAVGTILADSSSIDFTYTDGTPEITAVVLPAGVDHNSLQNYSANRHIDHTAVSISTAADSGLSGGGDISSTRSLVVDINGTTAETSVASGDEILIYDVSASARRKMTRANFLSGIPVGSAGDINETSFTAADNQASAANVTGLAFANGTVRSFEALVSIVRDTTFAQYKLNGIQKGASWEMSQSYVGDDTGLAFSVTNAGQVQYTSTSTGNTATVKFRAQTTSV